MIASAGYPRKIITPGAPACHAADMTLQPADKVLAVVHATQAGKLAALLGPRKG